MAPGLSRPRSSTSISTTSNGPRPISRASTTSINTTSEQPTQDRNGFPPIFPNIDSITRFERNLFTPEEMISRTETQLKNPHQPFVEPTMQQVYPQSRAMSVDTTYSGPNETTRPQITHSVSHDGQANNALSPVEDTSQGDTSKIEPQKKAKGSASSQANDQELRRLFRENCHRDLKDVAASVLANERGPKSEKTKQIFAMNWLSIVCKKSTTSVPRNRVYAQYAERCGTERVPLLNPASFGKLVRIIFPDITTRRLGMRGESKYHYVDLALETDEPERNQMSCSQFPENQRGPSIESTMFRHRAHTDTADFPSPDQPFHSNLPKPTPPPKIESGGHLFLNCAAPDLHQGPSRANMIRRHLKFPTHSDEAFFDESPLRLPILAGYLPTGTDLDTAAALRALYRSHCVSIIDCVRFCKEKSFWHHFTSFHGTLTVPVQKLFAHPDVAPWIRECDWLMYQKMVQFVSPLALQVMPEVVTNAFQSIADNLGRHILSIFSGHPEHVRDAKHGPAVIFAALLGRLLRVNAASHAAAHILGNDATREQMWHDWVYHVKPTIVAESCLPGVGYSRCIQILTNGIRDLLSPLAMTSYPGMQQIYHTTATSAGASFSPYNDIDDSSTSSVLDRWVTFLHDLPSRFPNADARTLLHCVSDVGTAALRDITMATAVSFGQWTVTKVWVDEMMQWLAEKGGFLENSPESAEMRPKKRSAAEAGLESNLQNQTRPRVGTTEDAPCQASQNAGIADLSRQNSQSNTVSSIGTYNVSSHGVPSNPQLDARKTMSNDLHVRPPPYYPVASSQPSPTLLDFHPNDGGQQSRPSTHGGVTSGQRPQPQPEKEDSRQKEAKMTPSFQQMHMPKDISFDDANDDSGIGLDLDLPQQQTPIRLSDYGHYVAHTNSDPADVVVC